MSDKPSYQFRTQEFPNNANGQHMKVTAIARAEADGWEVLEESVQPADFETAKGVCLFLVCAPLAFFAYKSSKLLVTFRKAN